MLIPMRTCRISVWVTSVRSYRGNVEEAVQNRNPSLEAEVHPHPRSLLRMRHVHHRAMVGRGQAPLSSLHGNSLCPRLVLFYTDTFIPVLLTHPHLHCHMWMMALEPLCHKLPGTGLILKNNPVFPEKSAVLSEVKYEHSHLDIHTSNQ
jgi:hypothetical protein